MNMITTYIISAYVGKCLAGAFMGGLIPLIVAFVKKRWGLGIAAFLVCGLAALIHSVASILLGVAFLIGAIKARKN